MGRVLTFQLGGTSSSAAAPLKKILLMSPAELAAPSPICPLYQQSSRILLTFKTTTTTLLLPIFIMIFFFCKVLRVCPKRTAVGRVAGFNPQLCQPSFQIHPRNELPKLTCAQVYRLPSVPGKRDHPGIALAVLGEGRPPRPFEHAFLLSFP